jgi:hypothetical protein
MPGETPTGDKAVYVFIEMIALGFVLYAIEEAFKEHPSWIKVGIAVVLGILFFLVGVNWAKLKGRINFTWLRRIESVASDYRYRYGLGLLLIAVGSVYTVVSLHSLRSDFDTYVMPRTITQKQADDLREYLSHHEAHAVTVKVNSLDREATEYAGQLFNALKRTDWDVTMSTSDSSPNTLNDGMCIGVVGQNAGPTDPKHDPQPLLQEALQSAHIESGCGSGIGAGDYKLFLLVGRRPLKLGDQQPMLSKIGRWIERLSQ